MLGDIRNPTVLPDTGGPMHKVSCHTDGPSNMIVLQVLWSDNAGQMHKVSCRTASPINMRGDIRKHTVLPDNGRPNVQS